MIPKMFKYHPIMSRYFLKCLTLSLIIRDRRFDNRDETYPSFLFGVKCGVANEFLKRNFDINCYDFKDMILEVRDKNFDEL